MSSARINGIIRAIHIFRKECDDTASAQKLAVFLEIAISPGIDNQTLIHRLDLSRSNASKLVRDLTTLTARKEEGPGLVRQELDPMDLTRRHAFLTEKGEQLFQRIREVI